MNDLLELFKMINKVAPLALLSGSMMVVLGRLGNPKKIKRGKQYVKWGLVIIIVTITLMVLQIPVLYSLLSLE